MLNKIKSLYQKYRELITYLFFAGTTTLINWSVYICLTNMGAKLVVANSLAWASGVIYAFVTNKYVVFESKSMNRATVVKEELGFLLARMFSGLVIEVLGLELLTAWGLTYSIFGIQGAAAKVTVCALSGISNYVFSKLVVFKKDKGQFIEEF